MHFAATPHISNLLCFVGEPLHPSVTVEEFLHNFINVSWTVPWSSDLAPVEGYVVQLLRPGGAVEEPETVTGSSPLTFTFEGLMFDTLYVVQVAAVNSVGRGEFGEVEQRTRIPDGGLRLYSVVACIPFIKAFHVSHFTPRPCSPAHVAPPM